VDTQLGAAQSLNSGLQTKVAQLQKFEDLKNNVAARQAMVDGLLHQQVLWSQVLQDMSAAMPDGAFLTSMTGTLEPSTDAAATVGAPAALVGNISVQGTALDYPDLTALLRRLERVDGWVNPWVSQATRAILDGQRVVQFTATVDLGPAATVNGRPQ
ncbi:MAG TPA: PilN domain-containing protein, partial [Actinomycetota bacterium]